jgi:predicted membrane GTPase involved in stress response
LVVAAVLVAAAGTIHSVKVLLRVALEANTVVAVVVARPDRPAAVVVEVLEEVVLLLLHIYLTQADFSQCFKLKYLSINKLMDI